VIRPPLTLARAIRLYGGAALRLPCPCPSPCPSPTDGRYQQSGACATSTLREPPRRKGRQDHAKSNSDLAHRSSRFDQAGAPLTPARAIRLYGPAAIRPPPTRAPARARARIADSGLQVPPPARVALANTPGTGATRSHRADLWRSAGVPLLTLLRLVRFSHVCCLVATMSRVATSGSASGRGRGPSSRRKAGRGFSPMLSKHLFAQKKQAQMGLGRRRLVGASINNIDPGTQLDCEPHHSVESNPNLRIIAALRKTRWIPPRLRPEPARETRPIVYPWCVEHAT
jgi:hypothetical protein